MAEFGFPFLKTRGWNEVAWIFKPHFEHIGPGNPRQLVMILSSPEDQRLDLETMPPRFRRDDCEMSSDRREGGDGKEPNVPFASFAAVVRYSRRSSLGISPTMEVTLFRDRDLTLQR